MDIQTLLTQAKRGDATAKGQLQSLSSHRGAGFTTRADSLDPEKRTLRAIMTTESPVPMIDWERWEMVPEILRADGMQAPAQVPFLNAHRRSEVCDVIGSVRDFASTADAVEGTATFARTDDAEEAFLLVSDGHITDVSVGYEVVAKTYIKPGETVTLNGKAYTGPVNVVTSWKLKELSLVPVGADPSAKIRAAINEFLNPPAEPARQQQERKPMTVEVTDLPVDTIKINESQLRNESAKAERDRITEISAMCAKHKIADETRAKLIQDGTSIEMARGIVLDELTKRSGPAAPAANMGDGFAPDMTDRERQRYSFMKAIRAAMTQNWRSAGFELEVSNAIAKTMGRAAGESNDGPGIGLYVPTNIPWYSHDGSRAIQNVRALDNYVGTAGTGTTGGTTVATNLLAGNFIDILRNKARVAQLGATMLSGLVGNVDIPRQTGASTAAWQSSESATFSQTALTFDKISLAIKTLGALNLMSRNLLMQSTPDAERLVLADLVAVIALAIDLAALSGAGSGGVPRGISNTSGIGSVVGGTDGAAITIDHLIDLETKVTAANVNEENLAYLVNAKTVGALKKLKSTTGQYLWTNSPLGQRAGTPGEINGYPVARTNQARSTLTKGASSSICSEVYFGDWSNVIIAEWGVLELLVNPFDQRAYDVGGLLVRVLQSVDIGIRLPASFSVMSDALTS